MLRSLYRTLFTYTIFRKYFTAIFISLLGITAIIEISFFYSDLFALSQRDNPSGVIQTFFALKWLLIFGFSLYFFYTLLTFKPNKKEKQPIITETKKTLTKEILEQNITPKTQEKLDRLLHKKKLQSRSDKILLLP